MGKIFGQDEVMSEIERIIEIFLNSKQQIRPHFILAGASGSGKTLIINYMCQKFKMDCIEVNAAQLTKEGTSGNSCSKVLSPLLGMAANRPKIIFVDEFDKLFISGNSNKDLSHEITNGVQNEFLKILESSTTSVFGDYGKYIEVDVSNTLFVFSGAFNNQEDINVDTLRGIGVKTEFLGRVSLVYNTKPLSLENMYDIVDNSTLLDNYLELFEDADREQVTYTIKGYIKKNFENNTLGARMVNTLINKYFIKSGDLQDDEVQKVTFQNKLRLK